MTSASSVGALAAAVLDAAPRRFALLGHGMGGSVAMEVLRRAPERVTRIVLMDTTPLAESPQEAAAREPHIIAARTGRLNEVLREEMRLSYLAPGAQRMDVLGQYIAMAESLGPDVYISQSRALQRRPDQQKVLRTTRVPALVMCGEFDSLFPVKRHEFMAELIPTSTFQVIEGAGHLPTLEQPDAVNHSLEEWLDKALVLK